MGEITSIITSCFYIRFSFNSQKFAQLNQIQNNDSDKRLLHFEHTEPPAYGLRFIQMFSSDYFECEARFVIHNCSLYESVTLQQYLIKHGISLTTSTGITNTSRKDNALIS